MHQVLCGDCVTFRYILDGTEFLQYTADTIGIPISEDCKGFRPFAQNAFNRQLGEENF
jgi:hypothetical protein